MHTGNMGKLLSIDARGKFGFSGGFGRIAFGYTRLGFYNWYAGIYQKKYLYGVPYLSRMKFYRPTNNQHENQQLWRSQVTGGWVAWRALDPETREQWRLRGMKRRMTGPNAFMSEWLKSHKSVLD